MKKIYKIGIFITGFILMTGLVYATVANTRKSSKLPWQGILSSYYDSAHNVGTNYLPESRFSFYSGSIAGGDSIISDSTTFLYWQSEGVTQGSMSWDNAKTYCADLELGGYKDWRLPNLKELQSTTDFSKSSSYIDENFFTGNNLFFWTSTVYVNDTNYAWELSFNGGVSAPQYKTNGYYVRCVR